MADCNVPPDLIPARDAGSRDDSQCSLKSPSLREETSQVAPMLFALDFVETVRQLINYDLGLETCLQ